MPGLGPARSVHHRTRKTSGRETASERNAGPIERQSSGVESNDLNVRKALSKMVCLARSSFDDTFIEPVHAAFG